MTFSEMKTEVWDALGQPSDLNPTSYTQIGTWLNRGYKKICFWKFPNGRRLRFRAIEGELFFQTQVLTGTAEDGAASTITLQIGEVGANDDQYNGWVVEIDSGTGSGQTRLIVDYTGSGRVATVAVPWDTTPDSTSVYSLYKGFMKFVASGGIGASENITIDPNDSIYDVLKVTDLEDERSLDRGDRTAGYPSNLSTSGTPGEYIVFGDRLVFDCPIDDERWYKMEYVKIPASMSSDADEPAIPEPWHDAIVLWAVWKGLMRQQEMQSAYATKRSLEDMIQTIIEQYAADDEREESYLVIDYGE